jgi:flavin reductase (DIM6/NTAB) family NADH-FMN oxidoreductase RutF
VHQPVDLPILYFGTPVVLISTRNEDGSCNIAPSSSIWWLGKSCMVGLDGSSKTAENLKREKECVLNLPSADLVESIDRIANTTGSRSVPLHKKRLGYQHIKDKAAKAQLTLESASFVNTSRITQCQVHLEASVANIHCFGDRRKTIVPMFAFEMDILQSHIEQSILTDDEKQYVDPDKWHPLIMSFRKFYTTNDYIHPSRLAEPSAENYRARELKGLKGKLLKSILRFMYKKYS